MCLARGVLGLIKTEFEANSEEGVDIVSQRADIAKIVKPKSKVPKSKVPKSRPKGLGLTQ